MNPDLAMGDELLKKTGPATCSWSSASRTWRSKDRRTARSPSKSKALDIYDPTTGEIRSSSTDDIACWFIDTELQRREFLRPPRLFHRGRRAL